MSKLLGILLIIIGLLGLFWLFKRFRGVRGVRFFTQRRWGGEFSQKADRRLQHRLLVLLRDDQGAADRLIQQAKLKYPGRSENWYWEKVIFDLERDRGRY